MADDRDAAARLRERLLALQQPGGAWSAGAAGPGAVEPTAVAMLALHLTAPSTDAAARPAVRRAADWLVARQRRDGSWPATEQVDATSWAGGVAILALARTGQARASVARGADWLLDREGVGLPWATALYTRWQRWRGASEGVELDWSLRGWPWMDDTFSWVEPTSVALLALRAAARDRSVARDERLDSRVSMGARMLVDRAVPDGGWNYGNARVLGEALDPYPDTTGWALLALAGVPGGTAVSRRALDRLPVMLQGTRSSLARALAALALRAHGRSDAAVRAALATRLLADGPPGEVRTQALALLALAGPPTPFTA